jgi:hypothetical protein
MEKTMKNIIYLSLLLTISLPLIAMEAPADEESYPLSKQEAKNLYWDTAASTLQELPYRTYKANMMRAIPIIKFTQHNLHNPLAIAVAARDIEFIGFLLRHEANPGFKDINDKSAFDVLNEPAGFVLPSQRMLNNLMSKNIFNETDIQEYKRIIEEGDLNNEIIEALLNSISAA